MRLTPSEQVVLFPDRFTVEGGLLTRKVDLPDGRKLASEGLGRAAAAAAILGCEAAGGLRLEVQEGRALLGLMRTRKLMAVPATDQTEPWPEGSLEAAVGAQLANGPVDVNALVQGLIGGEHHDPAAELVTDVQRGLARRGLLASEQVRVMKILPVMRYLLNDETRTAMAAGGPGDVEALLRSAEAERPEVWRELERGIRAGIAFMTASSDD